MAEASHIGRGIILHRTTASGSRMITSTDFWLVVCTALKRLTDNDIMYYTSNINNLIVMRDKH